MSARISNYVQDFRVPCNFMRDLRFMRMFRDFGAEGALAILRLWDWVSEQYPTTGKLERVTSEVINLVCGISSDNSEFITAMIKAGALAQDEAGTYYLPNWIEEQPYAAEAEKRSNQARENAYKRWGRCATTAQQTTPCTSNATALQSECSNTNSNTNIKSPPTPPRGGESEIAPVSEIVALYREVLPELPKPREEAAKLGRDIEARWKSKPEARSLEWWRGYFEQVREYPYLMGEVEDWRAGLAWLVCRTNMDKVLAGHYVRRSDMEPPKSRGMSNEEFEQMRAEQRAAAEAAGYLDPDMP